jgi:hypothetical protein
MALKFYRNALQTCVYIAGKMFVKVTLFCELSPHKIDFCAALKPVDRCAIYKKHQLQLKREFRKQNTYVELILHHLSEKPCDIHFISVKLPKLCYSQSKDGKFSI